MPMQGVALPATVLRPMGERQAQRHRRRSALVGGAALVGLLAAARAASRGAAAASEEPGLGFVAPPAPPSVALRGAGAAAPSAASAPSASSSVAGAGTAALAFAVVASALAGGARGRRMALRAKKLEELNVGDEFEGTVTRVANIGVWLDIGAEKEALFPKIQLPKGKTFKPGDKISGLKIFELMTGDTPATRKIRVTNKVQVGALEVGNVVEGTVARTTTFGVFFDIGASTDVLGPNRLLSKEGKEYNPGETYKLRIDKIEGEKVTVTTKLEGGSEAIKSSLDISRLKVGDKVEGKVVNINKSFGLWVDIGASRDALCRTQQLEKPLSEYKAGDSIPGLRVSAVDKTKGQVEVSPRRMAMDVTEGERLEGTVTTVGDFGIFFDAGLSSDVLAPTRLLSKPKEEYSKGEVADLIVFKVEGTRITVTTKSEDEVGTPLSKLVRGALVTGTVQRADESIGVFVDIGATKDALMRLKALAKPIGEYKEGDKLEELVIMKVDPKAELLEVWPQETMASAAQAASEEEKEPPLGGLTVGMEVEGTVTRAMAFGVFLDVGAKRDALWPASQLPKPVNDFKVGEKITGLKVTEADPVNMRLSVSTRPCPADFKVGDPVAEGRVTKVMKFGVFVDIGASCEALCPQSLLEKPIGEYKQGDVLTGLSVATVDASKNQISVGQRDPASAEEPAGRISMDDLKVGDKITGVVRQVKDYGIFMDVGLGRRDALLPASLLGEGNEPDQYKANQELEVYVANVDKQANRVTLSMAEPPAGGIATGRRITADWIPKGDMAPDPKFYAAKIREQNSNAGEDIYEMEEDPIPWKEWAQKYPGFITYAEKETEMYIATQANGFKGYLELINSNVHHVPVPMHLRKPDAGLPQIPEFSFDDYKMGYEHHGIKPEIHTKYRQPPFNNPNWTPFTPKRTKDEEED